MMSQVHQLTPPDQLGSAPTEVLPKLRPDLFHRLADSASCEACAPRGAGRGGSGRLRGRSEAPWGGRLAGEGMGSCLGDAVHQGISGTPGDQPVEPGKIGGEVVVNMSQSWRITG